MPITNPVMARKTNKIPLSTRCMIGNGLYFLAERPGSGDRGRKMLLTRLIAVEPLPASVLFGLGGSLWSVNISGML